MADPGQPLEVLVFCGLLGAVGQFVRAIGGLNKMYVDASANNVSSADLFVASRLVFSLLIGFVAGVLAGIATGLIAAGQIPTDATTMFGIAASGYAGVDFIESVAPNIVGKTGAQAAQQKADDTKNQIANLAANLQPNNLLVLGAAGGAGSVYTSVTYPGDLFVRQSIAKCLNDYKDPPPSFSYDPKSKYWTQQLSKAVPYPDWPHMACQFVGPNMQSPFHKDGLNVNAYYILVHYEASKSFTVNDFFTCIQNCYKNPQGARPTPAGES